MGAARFYHLRTWCSWMFPVAVTTNEDVKAFDVLFCLGLRSQPSSLSGVAGTTSFDLVNHMGLDRRSDAAPAPTPTTAGAEGGDRLSVRVNCSRMIQDLCFSKMNLML